MGSPLIRTSEDNFKAFQDEMILEARLSRNEKRLVRYVTALAAAFLATFALASWAIVEVYSSKHSTPAPIPLATRDISTIPVFGTTDLTLHQNQKRFPWVLAAVISNVAFSLFGLVSGCQQFASTKSAGDGVLCVYGAISTAASFIGFGAKGLSALNSVGDIAGEGVQIGLASLGSAAENRHAQQVLAAYNAKLNETFPLLDYTYYGSIHANHSHSGHLVPAGYMHWPVHTFTNHRGHKMIHTSIPGPDGTTFNRLGFAPVGKSKRDNADFNNEHFTSGAIDFSSCPTDESGNGDSLNSNDFSDIEGEIECYLPQSAPPSGMSLEFFDGSTGSTVSVGSIAAVAPDGSTNFENLANCPAGVGTTGCGVEHNSRRRSLL